MSYPLNFVVNGRSDINWKWSYFGNLSFIGWSFNKYTRWDIITAPPSFKQHNLVNIQFIYMKILGNIAEGMLSLQIWK